MNVKKKGSGILGVVVLIIAGIIINIYNSPNGTSRDETYIGTSNKNVKIVLTEETANKHVTIDNDENNSYDVEMSGVFMAYLYIDDEVHEGTYHIEMKNFKKYFYVIFYGFHDEIGDVSWDFITDTLVLEGNKLTFLNKDAQNIQKYFLNNRMFKKLTWWNIWGKKVIIILAILFAVWLFKDVPKMLKDREMMKFFKDDFKETFNEGMNDIIEDLKDPYNNKNNTNGS